MSKSLTSHTPRLCGILLQAAIVTKPASTVYTYTKVYKLNNDVSPSRSTNETRSCHKVLQVCI